MPPRPDEVVRKPKRAGFVEFPGAGSHRVFKHPDGRRTAVRFHRKELRMGTWKAILKQIGLSEEEYRDL